MSKYYIDKVVDDDLKDFKDFMDIHVYCIYLKSDYHSYDDKFICECACEEDATYLQSLLEDAWNTPPNKETNK